MLTAHTHDQIAMSALVRAMDSNSQLALRWTIAGNLLERYRAHRGLVASLHARHEFRLPEFIDESLMPQAAAHGFQIGRLDLRKMLESPGIMDHVEAQMSVAPPNGLCWLWIFENTIALALAATKTWQPLIRALALQGDRIQVVFAGAQWQVEPILMAWRAHSGAALPAVHFDCRTDHLQ
jgi:hypothetical protein